MPEFSGPLPGEKFTLSRWFEIFGDDTGIIGDTDGSAYGISLPSGSDDAEIGSATIKSLAVVGGHPHIILAGQTKTVTIPPSSGGGTTGRTDRIVLRRDPATYGTAPGPIRLTVLEGTEGSAEPPAWNPATDLRLFRVTRKEGEGLNQAIATPEKTWLGRSILVSSTTDLSSFAAPLGTRAHRGNQTFLRQMASSAPAWVDTLAHVGKYQSYTPTFNTAVTLNEARWREIGDDIRGYVIGRIPSMPSEFTCSLPVPGRSTTGWINPIGTATARSGNSVGANTREGFVIPQGSGLLTTVTVVAADGAGNRWGPNVPIGWNDHPDGGWFGISFQYERA